MRLTNKQANALPNGSVVRFDEYSEPLTKVNGLWRCGGSWFEELSCTSYELMNPANEIIEIIDRIISDLVLLKETLNAS